MPRPRKVNLRPQFNLSEDDARTLEAILNRRRKTRNEWISDAIARDASPPEGGGVSSLDTDLLGRVERLCEDIATAVQSESMKSRSQGETARRRNSEILKRIVDQDERLDNYCDRLDALTKFLLYFIAEWNRISFMTLQAGLLSADLTGERVEQLKSLAHNRAAKALSETLEVQNLSVNDLLQKVLSKGK
jgi:hypothetical protein